MEWVTLKKYVFAVVTVLVWSTTASVVKSLLNGLPDMQALSISSFLAFAFLLAVNLWGGSVKSMGRYSAKDYGKMAGLGFLGLFVYSALFYYGVSQLTSQQACVLNYLWPIMIVIFSCPLLKEKLTPVKIAAMACSFIGIVILTSGIEQGQGDGNTTAGIITCVAAAVCYGLFSVLNKKAGFDQKIAMMVIWLTTAVCALAAGLLTEQWVPMSGIQWLGMLWLGVVIDAIAYLLWALALNDAENTAAIANIAYLTPFLSLVVSAVFLKEPIELTAVAALVFIVGGILLQNFFPVREKKPE